jgi:two-component system response regulator AtoC
VISSSSAPAATTARARARERAASGSLTGGQVVCDWGFLNSPPMHRVKEIVERVARTDATVLIWGESGVGKELVARAIHECSGRHQRAFLKVNCAALPLALLESELFGYEPGAFTGAHRQKPGKFELANSGTILLDEIGEMPLPLQAKLLQVLQDGEFSRLGSKRDVRVDVRVVAATNKDLGQLAQSGSFREDLLYRLNVVNVHVPPLRERREEIPALLQHFLRRYSQQYGRPYRDVSARAMACLEGYAWPGNVRELENTVKRIVVLESDDWVEGELLTPPEPAPLPPDSMALDITPNRANGDTSGPGAGDRPSHEEEGLKAIARRAALDAEKIVLKSVLDQVRWNRVQAARRLKVSYKTLRWKIRQCGLED